MKLHIIKVTQEDIDTGSKKSCFDCALAYAIMRDMNVSYRNVSVAKSIRIYGKDIIFPKWLENWIIAYDKGENVCPIEFAFLERRMPLQWLVVDEYK